MLGHIKNMTSNTMSENTPLSASQSKAARALLGWTQQVLAQRANVAVSTVADFERDKRIPMANNQEALRNALEMGGISLKAGGVKLRQAGIAAAQVKFKGGAPIRWVDATDLSHWADRLDSHSLLPELISRLIRATTQNTAVAKFRSGDSIQQSGWDGTCEVAGTYEFIPSGKSGWELTTQKDGIKAKADGVLAARVSAAQELDPIQTTFVFVTLRRWAQGERWARDRRNEKEWLDVKVIDADDLVQWIGACPDVGYWLSAHLRNLPRDISQLSNAWREWSLSTNPPLTAELLRSGRDTQAMDLLRWVYEPPAVYAMQGDSADEAVAFLYSAIDQLPDEYRDFYHSKCVLAKTSEAARILGTSLSPLIVILENGDAGLAARLVEQGHHVFLAFGSAIGVPGNIVILPRPPLGPFTEGLVQMGIEDDRAEVLAKDSARSFSVLRRLIPSAPTITTPAWAENDNAPKLIAALFAGAWNNDQPADRAALAELAGAEFEAVEQILALWVDQPDSPLRRAGATWKITSPRDAWQRLAHRITQTQLERFRKVALEVLGAADPRFDLDPEKRMFAGVTGEIPKYSMLLRAGLAETLVLLALYGDEISSLSKAGLFADRIVSSLLTDADEKRWWSIRDQLREFAEASPEVFLGEVGKSLNGEARSVMGLFREGGGPFGAAYHSDLLWALETLAWSSKYLGRVSMLLAKLSRLDPGGRYANRPRESLRRIFLLWYPQTYATLEQRTEVLDYLRKIEPDEAWRLMLGVTPTTHDSAIEAAKPRWRDFSAANQEVLTNGLIYRGATIVIEKMLEDVGNNHKRWSQLLERVENFPPEMRNRAIDQLVEIEAQITDENERILIWSSLRKILHHHRQFPDAEWAMPKADVDRLGEMYSEFEPQDPIKKVSWLFHGGGSELPQPTPNDWEADEKAAEQMKLNAIADLFRQGGIDLVLALAESATYPSVVGEFFVRSISEKAVTDALLRNLLRDETPIVSSFVYGMVIASSWDFGTEWSNKLLNFAQKEELPATTVLNLLLALPAGKKLWDQIETFGEAVSKLYWGKVSVLRHGTNVAEYEFGIKKLIQHGRARDAVRGIGSNPAIVDPELLINSLTEAATQDPRGAGDQNEAVMFQWSVEQILGRLDKDPAVTLDQMVKLEWMYLMVLQHSKRPPTVLPKQLASDPALFCQVVSTVYRPANSGSGQGASDGSHEERNATAATHAYHLLHAWHSIPGDDGKAIDAKILNKWVADVRALSAQQSRSDVADRHIGRVLSQARVDTDGHWPETPVRDLVERVQSEQLELGMFMGIHDKRGVTSRGLLDGGNQERALARSYRTWAEGTRAWPRTSALLDRVADTYQDEARQHDDDVERRDWER